MRAILTAVALLLAVTVISCSSSTPQPDGPNLEATVAARVQATVSAASGGSPTSTPTGSSPTVEQDNATSKGLGADRAEWEKEFGRSEGYKANYKNGYVYSIERALGISATLPELARANKELFPSDSVLKEPGTQRENRIVDLYHSKWLEARYGTDGPWTGGQPGQFVAAYYIEGPRVISYVLTTGNIPPAPPTAVPTTPPVKTQRAQVNKMSQTAIQGAVLYEDTVWVNGELTNEGDGPAYSLTTSARLLSASGTVAGAGSDSIDFLAPGQTVAYSISIRRPAAWTNFEISGTYNQAGYSRYGDLKVSQTAMRSTSDTYSGKTFRFAGVVTNTMEQRLEYCHIFVWFLDADNRVVAVEETYTNPSTMSPGSSTPFDVESDSSRYNLEVSKIVKAKAYAYGRLP